MKEDMKTPAWAHQSVPINPKSRHARVLLQAFRRSEKRKEMRARGFAALRKWGGA